MTSSWIKNYCTRMDVDFNQTGSLYLPMSSYFYIFTLKHNFLWVISFESRELLTSTFSSKYLSLLLSSFLSFTILLGSESLKKKSWIKALDFFKKCCNSIIFMSFFKVFSSVKLMTLICSSLQTNLYLKWCTIIK